DLGIGEILRGQIADEFGIVLGPISKGLSEVAGFRPGILFPKCDNVFFFPLTAKNDGDTQRGERGWEVSMSGEGFGTEDQAVPIFFFGILGIIAARHGAGFQKTENGLPARGTQNGVPVVEQESGLLVGEAGGQAGSSDSAGLPGFVAESFQQTQTDGLAGLFLGR